MSLTPEEIQKLKDAFNSAVRPVILFDNDHDGLSSFLMLYKKVGEGKGIPMKHTLDRGDEIARKVNEYDPDMVIMLDLAVVSQEFIDQIKCERIIWLDHHPLTPRRKVEYYNPRNSNPEDNRPTSYWMYKVLEENLWTAMIGMVGDWYMPEDEIRLKFSKEYPDLLPEHVTRVEDALYSTKLGDMVNVFNFNLKGMTTDVMKSIKTFTRIKTPHEILNQETPGGKFLYKKYKELDDAFHQLIKQVHVNPKDKLVVFVYEDTSGISFTTQVSNYLIYKHPEQVILVAWEYGGEYKCSLRANHYPLPKLITKALEGMHGTGGGHDKASGACVRKEDFQLFVEQLKEQLR
jgi:single-stranded DNA-specific DHH superfamily exonuclease